jgi:hypothetical protein
VSYVQCLRCKKFTTPQVALCVLKAKNLQLLKTLYPRYNSAGVVVANFKVVGLAPGG